MIRKNKDQISKHRRYEDALFIRALNLIRNVVKKGVIEEIFSKALFADEAKLYKIFYRDFERIVECTMLEFLIQSENLQTIPINRINKIMKNNTVLFEKKISGYE